MNELPKFTNLEVLQTPEAFMGNLVLSKGGRILHSKKFCRLEWDEEPERVALFLREYANDLEEVDFSVADSRPSDPSGGSTPHPEEKTPPTHHSAHGKGIL